MNEQQVTFASAGHEHRGVVIRCHGDEAGPRPGVLVLHGGAGLGAHERSRAAMLAEDGYVAFAPDLFGETFTSAERARTYIAALAQDAPRLRARLFDALTFLVAQPRVDGARMAVVGFCFGGLAALELARAGASVRAVVSVHGGLTTASPAQPGAVKASVLACTGAADPFVTRAHRAAFEDEMTAAGADWQLHVYGKAQHGFTERPPAGVAARPGQAYDASADVRSWASLRALFAERLA